MSRRAPATCRIGNWSACNEALKRRGSLTIWFDSGMSWAAVPTGRRGRQQSYSSKEDQELIQWINSPTDAIRTCLPMEGEGRPENSPVDCFQP